MNTGPEAVEHIVNAVQIITIPALIAAFLYILTAYLVYPLVRRHRERYSQYAPVDNNALAGSRLISATADFFGRLFHRSRRTVDVADEHGEDYAFGEEEGESMVGFDLSHRNRTVRDGNIEHSDARLSRDLEEGFRDDSDDETENRAASARDTS